MKRHMLQKHVGLQRHVVGRVLLRSYVGRTGKVQRVIAQLEAAQAHKGPAKRAPERCQQPRGGRSAANRPARTQHALLTPQGSVSLAMPVGAAERHAQQTTASSSCISCWPYCRKPS